MTLQGPLPRGPGLIPKEEGVEHKPDSPYVLEGVDLTCDYHYSNTARAIKADYD